MGVGGSGGESSVRNIAGAVITSCHGDKVLLDEVPLPRAHPITLYHSPPPFPLCSRAFAPITSGH